jgi:antitoxin component YwqK of YwqJK toxin-antitoxin module
LERKFLNWQQTGKDTVWYQNGQKLSQGEYLNDKRIGVWTEWYDNGQKSSEGEYFAGQKTGKWIEWDKNGNIKKNNYGQTASGSEINLNLTDSLYYCDNKVYTGKIITFYENTLLKEYEQECYKGKVYRCIGWHRNGQKKSQGKYVKNQKKGKWIVWDEGGLIKNKGKYRNGQKTGQWKEWDDSKRKYFVGMYVHDQKNGRWISRYYYGQKETMTDYLNGKAIRYTEWDEKKNIILRKNISE